MADDDAPKLNRAVFGWIDDQGGSKKKNFAKITAHEVASKHGVPQETFKKDLEKELAAAESCSGLPFTLVLVMSYAAMSILHSNAPATNAVEDSIGFDIIENANFAFSGPFFGPKNIHDVNSFADFWSWTSMGLVPLMLQQQSFISEDRDANSSEWRNVSVYFPRDKRGVLLNYNKIVLGIRFRQERLREAGSEGEEPCASGMSRADDLADLWGRSCVGAASNNDYKRQPDKMVARYTANPQKEKWVYLHDDFEEILGTLEAMQTERWLDEGTRKVEIAIPVYNSEYGLHAMIYCMFFFSRGGHTWKDIIALNAFDFWFQDSMSYGFDGLWLLCVLYIVVMESIEIVGVIREFGPVGIKTEYFGPWNMVDWISVASAMMLVMLIQGSMSQVSSLNSRMEELSNIDEMTFQKAYRDKGVEYMTELENTVRYYYWLQFAMAFYPMVIVLRLFKAFGAQPRLALVTSTIQTAFTDLVHFMLIWVSVFVTFVVAGLVLFGREVDEWMNFQRAVITSFRIFLGDFDWEEMSQVGRTDAAVWLFPYIIIMVMVLMNMLVAVVMDAYAQVVQEVKGSDTLWSQGVKDLRRFRAKRAGEAVSLHTILSEIQRKEQKEKFELEEAAENEFGGGEMAAEEKILKVGDLKAMFSDMKIKQARELIMHAVEAYYNDNKEGAELDEAMELIKRINHRTRKLKWRTRSRVHVQGQAREDPVTVRELVLQAYGALSSTRTELGDWLPEDVDDAALPQELLVEWRSSKPLVRRADPKKKTAKQLLNSKAEALALEDKSMGVGNSRGVVIAVGTTAEVLSDENYVLDACRKAGIDTQNDDLRRASVGKQVKVLERDDRDGTVRCHVPGIGLVWFALGCFVSRSKDDGREEGSTTVGSDQSGPAADRVTVLGRELEVGRETVQEAIQAVNELHAQLVKTKDVKRHNIHKFHDLRQKAVKLNRDNRSLKQRFDKDQLLLKRTTAERDRLFDEVKALVERNRELEAQIANESIRRRGYH